MRSGDSKEQEHQCIDVDFVFFRGLGTKITFTEEGDQAPDIIPAVTMRNSLLSPHIKQ